MLIRQLHRDEEAGFTLIELLIVIFLLSVLGAVTSTGIIQALKGTRQDSARANSVSTLETQLQRFTRDVRVADPVRVVTSSDIVLDVYRSGGCRRIEWRISGTNLQQRTQTWTAATACSAYPATTTATSDTGYLTRIRSVTSPAPLDYLDNTGTALASPTTATVKQVRVSLTQSQTENRAPITVTASVYLRNAS